jgi:hypothetical protein
MFICLEKKQTNKNDSSDNYFFFFLLSFLLDLSFLLSFLSLSPVLEEINDD